MDAPKTLHTQWQDFLKDEWNKPYYKKIIHCYKNALKQGQIIFPPKNLIFNAFNLTPPDNVRIVILGQDPYHGSILHNGTEIPQAMGLSFSVPRNVPIPPSLKNIYKEITTTLGITMPNHGDLTLWAKRGALLLNSIFSVQKGKAGSHKDFGWEDFSDAVIKNLSQKKESIVFMLWGNYAKQKASLIDSHKHFIITAPHPSPLARGFIGSGVFTKAKEAFIKMSKPPFDWRLE